MAGTGYHRRWVWLALVLAVPVRAGELEALPATERGFQEKIQAFIKPGHKVDDALKILEAYRFECREFQNKHPVIHCSRMDEPRYYQVMIEPTPGDFVKTVTPSVGMIRR